MVSKMLTDVVVVGGSAAGLAAAITAAESGARVILLEKEPFTGGLARLGMGIAAVESRYQRALAFPFKRDDAFKLIMEQTDWRADARLVRAWVDEMPHTIEWLENLGVEFELLDQYQSPEFVTHTGHLVKRTRPVTLRAEEPKWATLAGEEVRITPEKAVFEGGRTAVMTTIMAERAKEKGVEIYTGTRAKKIIMRNGRVAGVIAEDKSGKTLQIDCKAVVIASGGFCHNKEMLKNYTGFELGRDITVMHGIELLGDGIKMAWEVGAAEDAMSPALIVSQIRERELAEAFNQPYNLVVNQKGERFVNEEKLGANWVHLAYAIARQKGRCAYVIFDGGVKRYMAEVGFEHISYLYKPPRIKLDPKLFDAAIESAFKRKSSPIFIADSLEELASKMEVDPEALKNTVEEYNRFCETGRDCLFNKNPRYLIPIKEPKFYACKLGLSMYTTVGGIKINGRTEVLNKEGDVIPGLYAAGDCTASVMAYDFSLTYMLWGNNLSYALNTGRIAGRNAAGYIKKLSA
jgi:fumarate reductase flavoprotein subunit